MKEIEYKWRAQNTDDFKKIKTFLRAGAVYQKYLKQTITDVYFDDESRTLNKTKTALRLRKINKQYEITLKEATQIKRGLARRAEDTLPLSATGAREAQAQFNMFFAKHWPGERPVKLFTIKNKRQLVKIKTKTLSAELAFDNCDILAGGQLVKFYEVELEFKEGSLPDFKKLAAQITLTSGLKAAVQSKVATAYKLLV